MRNGGAGEDYPGQFPSPHRHRDELLDEALLLQELICERSKRIPEDVAIACVDCSPEELWETASLTRRLAIHGLRAPRRQVGEEAAQRLLEWVVNPRFKGTLLKLPYAECKGGSIGPCLKRGA